MIDQKEFLLYGGNWQNGVCAGFFRIYDDEIRTKGEILGLAVIDKDGLPDRWITILRGETELRSLSIRKIKRERNKT